VDDVGLDVRSATAQDLRSVDRVARNNRREVHRTRTKDSVKRRLTSRTEEEVGNVADLRLYKTVSGKTKKRKRKQVKVFDVRWRWTRPCEAQPQQLDQGYTRLGTGRNGHQQTRAGRQSGCQEALQDPYESEAAGQSQQAEPGSSCSLGWQRHQEQQPSHTCQ